MHQCRFCKTEIETKKSIVINVPAGTQLFSDDENISRSLKTDIQILKCSKCDLIQLSGEPVVYENVSSSSSFVSEQLTDHRLSQLRNLIDMRTEDATKGSLLEIGCGDGHLLTKSKNMFSKSVGIEPTRRNAETAVQNGLTVHQTLMHEDTHVEGAPFNYFCSFHVLEHVTDICSVLKGIRRNLSEDAVGIIEVPSTESAIINSRYGDFMPDHLNYFTENTLRLALEYNGFCVNKIYRDWGGEHLVAYVRNRSDSKNDLNFIIERQNKLINFVKYINESNLTLALWGVSHHLMPYMPLLSDIDKIHPIDTSPSKIGKYIPSTALRVESISTLTGYENILVAITAPRFHDEILEKLLSLYSTVKLNSKLSDLLGFEVMECKKDKVHIIK